jgi:phage shock protein A
MNIKKVQWNNSESRVNLSFPITKVDKEKRTVSGFATLDNIDRHGDVVTAEASEKAFQRFRGNLREMHQPIAIGKVLSFHPEEFFDKESGKTYKGIYVQSYVSKGAQDTWEKVLDGTLTGFSIGGNIVQSAFEPGDEKENRVIKEYDLMELSLVDTPANPLANIFSIQKNADGNTIVKGMAADTTVENVFWCLQDKIASSSSDQSKDCLVCGAGMENIGWVESSETEKGLVISKIVDSYLKKDDAPNPTHSATTHDSDPQNTISSDQTINLYPDQNKIKKSESIKDSENAIEKGGNKMADETNNAADAVVEAAEAVVEQAVETVVAEAAAEVVAEAETAPAEELVEKSVTSAEAEQPFAKMLTELRDLFGEAVNKNSAEVEEKLQKSVDSVTSARAEMESAVSDIKKELTALTGNIADFFKRFEELEKRFSSYESDTAVQKSIGDVDSASRDTKLQKNFREFDWQGSFLGVHNL